VRAFDPWPVAESRLDDGTRLRVWRAEPLGAEAAAAPGTIAAAGAAGIDVATGAGVSAAHPSPTAVGTRRWTHRRISPRIRSMAPRSSR
jgi:hypothetical protein